jgi:hypothetical protein
MEIYGLRGLMPEAIAYDPSGAKIPYLILIAREGI